MTSPKYNTLNEKTSKLYKLLKDVEQELYPGCGNFSKLSFIIQLLNIKCLFGLSAKEIGVILMLLTKAFSQGNKDLESYFKAQKIIHELGHDYTKINACMNDCIFYRRDYLKSTSCPTYKFPRYKDPHKKLPQKVMRYFPSVPRLQKLYVTSNTVIEMRWHKDRPYREDRNKYVRRRRNEGWKLRK
uniref:Uncharacterized protein n=1 Tax=Phaseolus vulgaris TaxID=3885 RepID=V7AHE7_PHAVU|nr:hypothetical protein PHAVU_011G113600g [Phaseolus vulgaris]ESW04650.1 hypothetical protein PHAVU_011G113600g [Phaseolus vulgaris]